MNATTTANRAEGRIQLAIMLAIGCAGAAASFTHVAAVASAHGQPGWLAWADAITLELMSVASGLEMRRRHRQGRSAAGPFSVLIIAVALSLSAQVIEAERSIIGWVAAAIPALGFLAMAKMALGRTVAAVTAIDAATEQVLAVAPVSPGTIPLAQMSVAEITGEHEDPATIRFRQAQRELRRTSALVGMND